MSRPRLLLVCYACRPGEGSEPALGWNRALTTARHYDVWVLCEESRNRRAIEDYLATHGPIPGLNFIYVPRKKWLQRLAQVPGMFYPSYHLWHRTAYKAAQESHQVLNFDLAHMVTYGGYREPGYTWKLPTKFVWGPVGGTHNLPWRFLTQVGFKGAIAEIARSLVNNWQFRYSRRVRAALRTAVVAIAGNSTTQRHMRTYHGIDMPMLPGGGIDKVSDVTRTRRRTPGPTRLLWVGRLQPLKGLPLLLQALKQLPPQFPFQLRIIGDGPARRASQQMSRRLGVDQHIEWLGWVPQNQVFAHYSWADEFVFTSLRDTMPCVVLEALAAGLPVITLDLLGMADAVNENAGIKIPVTTPARVIADIAAAIVELVRDPREWEARSRAAVERAAKYTWDNQAEELNAIYERVLNGTKTGVVESPLALPAFN